MEEQEILVGNKLIAEFMELDKVYAIFETGSNPLKAIIHYDQIDDFIKDGYIIQLPYNSSWDWLMPVVEKIQNLYDRNIIVTIIGNCCEIKLFSQYCLAYDVHLPEINFVNENSKIEATFLAIIEFIKWHNEQKK